MSKSFERKNPRLDREVYEEYHIYSLTLSCYEGKDRFTNRKVIRKSLEFLEKQAEKHDMSVHAYCFMPDHLHILVEGEGLIKFVKQFKQITGYHYKQATGEKLWQKSFYDHILREEEDLRDVARYIFKNPTREGLVRDFREYPYSGSFEFSKENI